jgi:carbonic anhydrase
MSKCEHKIVKGNKKHVSRHSGKHESEEASKHVAIISCMDARIPTLEVLGFKQGQAYLCQNGGGRASDDAIRSVVLAIRLFAVDTIIIMHHTDCGLEKVDDPHVRRLLRETLGPAQLGDKTGIDKNNRDKYHQSDYVAFLAFENLEKSVLDDVAKLRENPLVSREITIYGYIYDVDTGVATKVCKSKPQ